MYIYRREERKNGRDLIFKIIAQFHANFIIKCVADESCAAREILFAILCEFYRRDGCSKRGM